MEGCFGGRATVSFPAGEVVLPHGEEVGMFGGGVEVLSSWAIQSRDREVSIEVLQEPLQCYLNGAPCGEVADQGLRCVFRSGSSQMASASSEMSRGFNSGDPPG